jgi:hypothetical protein
VTTLLRLLFLVPIGYIAAIVAAGFMMAFGLFGYEPDPEHQFFFTASVVVWTFWAGAVAFVPAIIAIILAETFGWRSILYWLAVGGGIGLVADRFDRYGSFDFSDQRTIVLLAAGFVAGFAYWLIAGRLAGTGSEPAPPSPAPVPEPPRSSDSPPEQA